MDALWYSGWTFGVTVVIVSNLPPSLGGEGISQTADLSLPQRLLRRSLAPVYFLFAVFVTTVSGGGNIICPLRSWGRGRLKVGCRPYIFKERGRGFFHRTTDGQIDKVSEEERERGRLLMSDKEENWGNCTVWPNVCYVTQTHQRRWQQVSPHWSALVAWRGLQQMRVCLLLVKQKQH